MKILITGSAGFIGKNLQQQLICRGYGPPLCFDRDTDPALLDEYCEQCDFVFHLAGVNRPEDPKEFMQGNFGFTSLLLQKLWEKKNKAPLLLTSSVQAELENPYGRSKKAGEELLFRYGEENDLPVYVFRLPGVFGKWCRPNYNSVVATFCHNIAHGLPIRIDDGVGEKDLALVYIDDVIDCFLAVMEKRPAGGYRQVTPVRHTTVGALARQIKAFREMRRTFALPNFSDGLQKALYSTYLSYLPTDAFSYPLKQKGDGRGSFTEFLRTEGFGQISVNRILPGAIKGEHWHHTKTEKFMAVSGKGVVRLRKIGESKSFEYSVTASSPEVLDIPPGYSHHIENTGDTDLVMLIWANEVFDPQRPDTFYEKV